MTSGYFQLNNVTMGADGILKLADSNVRTEWNGTAGGTFANDVVFTGNQVFATKDFTFSGDLSGTAFSTQERAILPWRAASTWTVSSRCTAARLP